MSGHIVRKIDRATGERIRSEIEAAGFEMRTAPHAVFSAKGAGVSVTYYTSGKLLVQGKGADDFGATYLGGPDDVPVAADPRDQVTEPIIGTDESGKGDYFGPLIVAAIRIAPGDVGILRTLGVRDSKSVGDREAAEIARQLHDGYGERIAIVEIGPSRYNDLHTKFGRNLNRLLAWAHARSIEDLLEREPCGRALCDKFGNERLIQNALLEKGRGIRLEQRVRAESHPAVAAASILARARFLRRLREIGDKVGERLPKGAGGPVDQIARVLYQRGGVELLGQVAKLHFRTTEKATGRLLE